MNKRIFVMVLSLGASLLISPAAGFGQGSLPDWSGVWQMVGNTVFDHATVEPANGAAGTAGVRERPPYNKEWEALYQKNIDRVKQGLFPDPLSNCGVPAGFPRIMNVPDVYEFVIRPEEFWIVTENGPNVMRIYTDGRAHPAAEDMWLTYTGDSVGRWEGDTLIFDTLSLKGSSDGDVIVDRTGLILSDQVHAVTRMKKINADTIEAQITIEDSKALTAPWHVTKSYRRQAKGTRVYDYACAENNRNPVSDSGQTLTLGPDGKPINRNK